MKKLVFFFTLLLSLNLLCEAQLNINHFIRVGRTRISIGNYTGAIEYFNIVIEFKPYLAEAYLYRGIAKHSLEDYRGAIQDYDKAIEIKPFYPMAYNNRGMAYHNLKLYRKAIADYNRALEFDTKNENIYNNRGLAKLALKNLDGAIEDYNKALEINPKSTHALMNRSNAKIFNKDTKGAIKDLNRVIIIRPHFASAYLNRGLARLELKDYASALRDFDMAIKFDPQNSLAYNNRGIVKQRLEDYQSAIMDYDRAIQLNPEMASAYFNRAMAREILNKPGFEKDYRIAARLNPQFDLSNQKVDAEKMAQQQHKAANQQNTRNTQNNQLTAQNKTEDKEAEQEKEDEARAKKEREAERQRRRAIQNLVIEDTRALPEENEPEGEVQNKNIAIDLQPIFFISAFEKNAVDYDRFQYYNLAIDKLNVKNNYNPILSITNKPVNSYKSIFENYILFFNEKMAIRENASNHLVRGILYSLTGNFNKAKTDLNKTIKMNEKLALAYFSRANCRYKMQEQIERITNAQNKFRLSAKQDKKGDMPSLEYQDILNDYQVALFLNPKFFFGYYNRAYIKLRLGQYRSAVEDLNHAIELEPEFAEAYFNRGLTKIFLDDVESGALDLSRAGELGIEGAYNIIKRYCN